MCVFFFSSGKNNLKFIEHKNFVTRKLKDKWEGSDEKKNSERKIDREK